MLSFVYYFLNIYSISLNLCSIQLLGHKDASIFVYKGYKEILGIQGSKLHIYTYLTFHSLCDNQRITEKLFAKARKDLFQPRLKYK